MPSLLKFLGFRKSSSRKRSASMGNLHHSHKTTSRKVVEDGVSVVDIRDVQLPCISERPETYWIVLYVRNEKTGKRFVKFVYTKCDLSINALAERLLRETRIVIPTRTTYTKPHRYDRQDYNVIDLIFSPTVAIHVTYAYPSELFGDTFDEFLRLIRERRELTL